MAERNVTSDFEQQPSYLTIYGNKRIQWNWKFFDYFSLMIIIPSCLNLVEEVKVEENNGHLYVQHGIHPTQVVLYLVYYVFLLIEIVIRVKGSPAFIRGQHAYLKNFFNVIDVLVFISWSLSIAYEGYVTLIPLRTLRIIYVFRDVAGFRLIWKTLSNALKSMGVIVVVILVIILHLATIGALLYSHHFNICFTTDVDLEQYAQEYKDDFDICITSNHFGNVMCFKNYTDCQTLEKEYHLGFVTFEENIFKTMFVVFQIMTLEGWSGITLTLTYEMMSEYRWYYFILVVFIGGYFALNLITGLIVTEFMREKLKMRWSIGDNQVGEDIYPKNYNPHGSRGGRGGSLNSDTDEFGSRSDDLRNRNTSYRIDYKVYMRDVLSGSWCNNAILVLISINALCLAIKHHGQSEEVIEFIQYVELFFVSAFLMEILMKVIVERSSYFNSIFNWFDLTVVVAASFCFGYFNDSFGLTSFRVIHLFQLFTYTGYSMMYDNFVTGFKRCLSLLMPLLVTYAIFDVIFASFGVDLIWYEKEDQYRIIAPYGSFQNSLVTSFQVMSGESWTYIMYKAVAAVGPNVIYLLYFAVTMVTGKLILSNILLPITMCIVKHTYFSLHPTDNSVANIVRNDGSGTGDYSTADESGDGNNSSTDNNRLEVSEDGGRGDESEVEVERSSGRRTDEEVDYRRSVRQPFLPYNTLFILTRRHWLRKTAHNVVNWYYFDLVMMLNVFLYVSVLWMILPSSFMYYVEGIYTTVAIIELILKVIDVGFVLHPGAYLTSGWNVLDLVALLNVIAFNIVRITSPLFFRNSSSLFGFWRSIRVVRLLRMFVLPRKYFPRLQPACEGAIKSMKNLVFLFIIYVVYLFIFSVVAVYLFNGQFHLCENGATSHNCTSQLTYETQETHNGTLINFKRDVNLYDTFHFNNLINSMVTLFAIQNGQDWIKIMELITDFSNRTTLNGDGSIHITVTIFFFVFLVVFSFFFIKLFSALVICTYDEEKSDRLRKKGFNKNQADCVSFVLKMESHKKYIPISRIGVRRKAWDIVNASCFEEFMMIIIALNALLFMMTIESDEKRMAYFLLNTLFSIFYVIECILKITAYKFTNYWKSWWNRMDLVIVVSDVIDVVVVVSMAQFILAGDIDEIGIDGFEANFLRTFHLLKAMKYIKPMYIRRLLWACKKSFNAIPHTFYPFGILLFVYAIIGVEVFTCYNHPYNSFDVPEFQTLGRHFGFHDISSTFLLLIRTATGENWLWTMNHAPLISVCEGDGVTPNISVLFTYTYFISFVILSTYIMMNLFPAMIIDNFSNLLMDNSVLGEHHLGEFVTNWTEYDPKATGKIHFKELFEMLKKMSPPLGLGIKCPNRTAYRKLMRLNIPVDDDGKVGYKPSLFALVRDNLNLHTGTFTRISERRKADIQLKKALRNLWPHTDNIQFNLVLPAVGDDQLTIGKLYAGCLIVDYWRSNSCNRTTNDL